MENDRGYITRGEWSSGNNGTEYEPVFYSETDSDYSDTEISENIQAQEIYVQPHELNTPRFLPEATDGTTQDQQRREPREEERRGEGESREEEDIAEPARGACGTNNDCYSQRWARREPKEEDMFDMEMDIDQFIASELDRERVDLSEIDFIEEQLEIGRLTIREEYEYSGEESFCFNAYIPAKYQWSEFDECCIGIYNQDLERRMKNMRRNRGPVPLTKVMELFMEVQESKMIEMHKIEKGKLKEDLAKSEKQLQATKAKLREAKQDQAVARGLARMMKERLRAKEEELRAERIHSKNKEQIIQAWSEGSKEAEQVVTEAGRENKKLLEEITELKMTISEMKKQERGKY